MPVRRHCFYFCRKSFHGCDLWASTFLKSDIETRNATFNRLIEQIERVAIASKSPMLITGPTGAGKTRLARRIFELKRRREQITGDFVEVNCAMPDVNCSPYRVSAETPRTMPIVCASTLRDSGCRGTTWC